MSSAEQKLIIDTDPGHDDAMALMLACASENLGILAVTTVCGNSTIENTTRNARYMLDFIGRNDVPVYSGADKPLIKELRTATVHGQSGLEGIDPTNESNLTGDAVERMLEVIKGNPGEVTLVALGPLTNVAQAIEADPSTMGKLKQIVAMGGAIDVPGNMNRVAEFNVFVDPDAADTVMRFPVPKTLVPLDACNRIRMQLEDFQAISDTRNRELLLRMVEPYIKNVGDNLGMQGAPMYDPLTIFYLLQPEDCTVTARHVLVETDGKVTRGMTVVDNRDVPDGEEPNVTVVNCIDPEAFISRFVRALSAPLGGTVRELS